MGRYFINYQKRSPVLSVQYLTRQNDAERALGFIIFELQDSEIVVPGLFIYYHLD